MVGSQLQSVCSWWCGLDHPGQFGAGVPVAAAELHQLGDFRTDGAARGGAGDTDSVSLAEFQQPFVAQQPQRTQDGVGVDVHDGGEVTCRWEPVAGPASPSAIARRICAATCS